ncbi:MAG: glycosyltransferase family 4 protein, partial [Verrucomicrobiia bacterium]
PFSIGWQDSLEHEYLINPFLLAKMLRERPDVIISGGYNWGTLNALLYRKLTGVRYVIWTEVTMMTDGRFRGAKLWLRRVMGRNAAAFIDAGTLAREYVRYLVPGIPDSRLFRAYNCVESARFMVSAEEGRSFLNARGLPPQTLLFVGKLNEGKGVPVLLKAYRQLVAERANLGLVLLGDGPLRLQIEEFKARHGLRHLHLPGFLENEKTAPYYAGASAFVLLSVRDRNPLVIFEALNAGVPILCSNRAGNAVDFIKDGVNGYIVDPLEIDDVVAKLREVLEWGVQRRDAAREFSHSVVRMANYEDAARAFVSACRLAIGQGPGVSRCQDD